MMSRAHLRLLAPILVGTASIGISFSIAAQAGTNAGGGVDGGVSSGDGGVSATTAADSGGPAAVTDAATVATPTTDASWSMPPPPKKRVDLPPPTAVQLDALGKLKDEANAYQQGAQDYKDAITQIVTLNYEQKKRTILDGLDREIKTETDEQTKARNTAIAKLEKFVAKYSGANASNPETPDAMFRLAALYEERGEADSTPTNQAPGPAGLRLAVQKYKEIILQFPAYNNLASVIYFLGHGLNDLGRELEAQQVWRSLVCNNRYKYSPAPQAGNPSEPADTDPVSPLAGDADANYWSTWRTKYPQPDKLEAAMKAGTADALYNDPYGPDCAAMPQPSLRPDQDPKFVAELWFRIGEYEFSQDDMGGGVIPGNWNDAVWDYNRAAHAYLHALDFKHSSSTIRGVTLYKYAWTLYKQQRYEAAVKAFLRVIAYSDEQEKLTGDTSSDFGNDPYIYVAGSLTEVDFAGPAPDEAFILRSDVLIDDPPHAEEKMKVGIQRVQDPNFVPQNKPYTLKIYEALADEYKANSQHSSAIEVYQLILDKWPLDPFAPDAQNFIAIEYDALAAPLAPGPLRAKYEAAVIDARTKLTAYVGTTPWTDANRENTQAILHAEDLVHAGLLQAAAAHKVNGQRYLNAAIASAQANDKVGYIENLQSALPEFKLEAAAMRGYLAQDENAPDAYQSRYFIAEAQYNAMLVQKDLFVVDSTRFPEPLDGADANGKPQGFEEARQSLILVRDSDEDDKYLRNSAFFIVSISDMRTSIAARKNAIVVHDDTYVPQLDAAKNVVVEVVPQQILDGMTSRDEYTQRVPANIDDANGAPLTVAYQFWPGLEYFVYGDFKDARARLEPFYKQYCGKDKFGYDAWKELIRMANLTGDSNRSTELANAEKAHSCAMTPEQMAEEPTIINPTLIRANYTLAFATLKKAQDAPAGDAKTALWKLAAGQFEAALTADPYDDDAPAGAMDSAYCYKQLADSDDAVRMYKLFIAKYGGDDILNALKNGGPDPRDPKKTIPADDAKYRERLGYLRLANSELSNTYYQFFDYPNAANAYATIAGNARFDEPATQKNPDGSTTPLSDGNAWRQASAQNALILYQLLGDKKHMDSVFGMMKSKLSLTPEHLGDANFREAEYNYLQWDPNQPDSGANQNARYSAQSSLQQYYLANSTTPASAKYALQAAYQVAKMMQTGGDASYHTWFSHTIDAWKFFKNNPSSTSKASDPPYNDYGAEAEFTLADEDIKKSFDYETGHHNYSGQINDVKTQYDKDTKELVNVWKPRMDAVIVYQSKIWLPAAWARTGTLFDSLRQGLDNYAPVYFDAALQNKINTLLAWPPCQGATNCVVLPPIPGLLPQGGSWADGSSAVTAINVAARQVWHTFWDAQMDQLTQTMISNYATSAWFARKANVKNDAVRNGINRLALYSSRDDFKDGAQFPMSKYVGNTNDPFDPNANCVPSAGTTCPTPAKLVYTDGMFLHWRNGMDADPSRKVNGTPTALPAALQ